MTDQSTPGDKRCQPFWLWEPSLPGFRNRLSDEIARYRGRVAAPPGRSDAWTWHRFDYESADAEFPLLIEERMALVEDFLDIQPRFRSKEPYWLWRLDFEASSRLAGRTPTFGQWVRLTEAFHGIALRWPRAECPLAPCEEAATNGGWLNGQWTSEFYSRTYNDWRNQPLPAASTFPFSDVEGTLIKGDGFHHLQAPETYLPADVDWPAPVWVPRAILVTHYNVERDCEETLATAALVEQSSGAALYFNRVFFYSRQIDGEQKKGINSLVYRQRDFSATVHCSLGDGTPSKFLSSPPEHYPFGDLPSRFATLMIGKSLLVTDRDAFERRFGAPAAQTFPIDSSPHDFMLWPEPERECPKFNLGWRPYPHLVRFLCVEITQALLSGRLGHGNGHPFPVVELAQDVFGTVAGLPAPRKLYRRRLQSAWDEGPTAWVSAFE